jgi:hypothetical protein
MKYSAGTLPHETLMTSIELFGTKVMPMVRERLAEARSGEDRSPASRAARP